MRYVVTALASTGPLLVDLWGVHVPALSMLLGLIAVVVIRIMSMTKDYRHELSFWYYNISLTMLMALITFVIIADRQLGPGLSVMMGIGVGASGMVIVDLLKDRAQNIVKAMFGKIE